MKKHVSIIIVLLALVCLLASCYGDGTHTHSFGEWETAKEPTCTEDGEKVRYCACGEEQIKPIYAGGHTEIVDEAVDATCTEAGLTEGKHCDVCDEVIIAQTVVAAKGHTEVVDEAVEPTCTTTGKTEGKHCSTCNEVLIAQTEVPKASHTYDDQYDESCNVCGFVRDAECAHTEVTILPAKDATCTESGLTKGKVCVKCEEILAAQTIIDAKGHTEVIDEAVEPTCTETGLTEGKHCSVCSEVLVDQTVLDANGHSFENRLCTVCGEWDYSKGLEFVSNGEGTCYVKSIGDCEDAEIIIPHYSPENDKVTSIYGRAFSDCRSLTSVIIPETVTVIDSYAFSGCLSLDNVVLPEGLTEIGRYAFQHCWGLESITISDGITMMEGAMFYDCKSLAKVNIPSTVTYIEASVFNGCTALESIVIPASVTQIDSWAFKECTSLTSILFECSEEEFANLTIDPEYAYLSNATEYYYSETKPTHVGNYWHYVDGVATKWPEYYSEGLEYRNYDDGTCSIVDIGTCTDTELIIPAISPDGYKVTGVSLDSCDSIVSVIIPEGVTSIWFEHCDSLESVIIPASVTSIGRWAFAYCTSLTSVTFLGNNTIIEQQAFEYCRSLKHFIVPDCNTVISYAAFLSCEALESIVIPKNVTKVEQWAFEFCDALEYVYYTGKEEDWNNIYIDSQNYGINNVEVICYSENAPTERGKFWHYVDGVPTVWPPYVIPDSVGLEYTDNGDGTCYVSGIGTCTDTIIKIPSVSPDGYTVTGIGWRAFNTYYGEENFSVCNAITAIVVPNTITNISGSIVYYDGSFSRLYYFGTAEEWANVIIDEYGNEEINANTVYFYSEMCPAESGNLWHYDVVPTPWTGIGLEYTSNDDGTCYVSGIGNCSETDLVIPEVSPDGDTVIAIGYEAFYNCDSLVSVYIPDTVTDIQEYAFANCYSLVSARLPECITYIAKSTFEGCSSLETIKIPNSVTEIGENAFYHCTLFTIEIPLSVTSIASGAFTGCSAANPDVYYHGSEWDWQQIQIGENSDYFTNATIYYYYNIE